MPLLILIPFGVFAVCCILQFWFLKNVRDALIDRHPETFLSIEKSSIFPMQGLWKFSRGSQHKQLGDANLDRHVRNLKYVMIVALGSWAVFAVSIFSTDLKPPRLPISIANGTYTNKCCGDVALNNGTMVVLNHQFSYVIESDKVGAYILTSLHVGASPRGFVVHPKGFPLKMYLDNETHPAAISLMDESDGEVFSFQRMNGS